MIIIIVIIIIVIIIRFIKGLLNTCCRTKCELIHVYNFKVENTKIKYILNYKFWCWGLT